MPNSIPSSEDITRQVLPNGIRVLVRENFDAQSVVIQGGLAGGSVYEDRSKGGLAALTAEALTRGTKTRDFDDLHETLESNGMSLESDGGRHLANFSGKALAEDLPLLLTLLGDVLQNPVFPEEHVDLIKTETVTNLQYGQQDTRYMAGKTFRELTYPSDHIYHYGSSGEIETVSKLTRADLEVFHARQYGPKDMIVVIVGAVKAADAVAEVERVLGGWQNPDQKIDYSHPDIPKQTDIRFKSVELAGKTQSDIILGIPGPSRIDADYQAARLANNILGVFGMMGRIGASVREEKGLAYYAYSGLDGGMGRGAWKVSAGVNPKNVKLAVDSIRQELDRMMNQAVSEQDLADNQANLIGRLPLLLENNGGVAGNIFSMERYNLGLDYLKTYADTLNSLTIQDLQKAFQHYWKPNAFNLAVAGPALQETVI